MVSSRDPFISFSTSYGTAAPDTPYSPHVKWRGFALSLRARFIFFAMLLGIAPVLISQSAPLDKQRMMQVVQNYVDNKSFMGDVLVAEGDHIVLKAAYGYADLDWSIE